MARIVLELSNEEAGIVYRALVEQFKDWVFSRLEKGVDEESDRMLRIAEGLTSRLEGVLTEDSTMRDIINKAIDDTDNV